MASKKISIPFSCLQKFSLSPLFPSKNFKTLKKSFAYPPPLLDVITRIFLKMTSSQLRIKQWDISPKHYVCQTLQTTKTNFEKPFFKTNNYDPFQSTSCLSIHASFSICCVFIPYVSVLRLYFMFYLLCWQLSLFELEYISCHISCKPMFSL